MHFIRLAYQDTADVMKFLAADKEALDPLCKSLTLDKDVALIYFESLLQEAVDSGVSYVVKSASDEIIAVRLSTFRTREEAMEDAQTLAYQDVSTTIGQAQALLRHLNQQFWAEVSPEVDKVYYLMAVVVASEYRETHVVDKLIHHNMDEVRTMGAQGLIADATIFHPESTLHKLGYRVIAEVDQGTFSDSKKGLHKAQLVFKEMWREESYGAHVVL